MLSCVNWFSASNEGAVVHWTPAFMRRDETDLTVGTNLVNTADGTDEAMDVGIPRLGERFGSEGHAALDEGLRDDPGTHVAVPPCSAGPRPALLREPTRCLARSNGNRLHPRCGAPTRGP
jgi:hypothetical protein